MLLYVCSPRRWLGETPDEVVDDYETDLVGEEGETQTLEIDDVTDDMTQYVCEPHQGTMIGDVEVV